MSFFLTSIFHLQAATVGLVLTRRNEFSVLLNANAAHTPARVDATVGLAPTRRNYCCEGSKLGNLLAR